MKYQEFLTKAGLTTDQSAVYESLLASGPVPARKVSLNTGIKRALCYKVIDQLMEKGLVEKIDRKVALFSPVHPEKVKELVETKKREAEDMEASLSTVLGRMSSEWNLISGKPNVQFFEGEEGVRKVLEDSLYSQEEILSYADITAIQKYIPKINEWYVEQREKKGTKKRAILLDTPTARNILASYHKAVTDARLIKLDSHPFESIMQIYDNKISYITLSEGQMIGVIIGDQSIYEMHRALFSFIWSKAEII